MANRIDGRVEIGRVHLTVADLERALAFYAVLGFEVVQRWGDLAALLGSGDGSYQLSLAVRKDPSRVAAPGTNRFALRYADRRGLADALRRLREASVPLDTAVDDGISETVYVRDPDGAMLELYRDRPREEWPSVAEDAPPARVSPLDLDALLREAPAEEEAADATPAIGISDATRERLRELRTRLLHLHKVLLDDARAAYEMDRGRVGTNANFLQLVIQDPWFAWLHSLSELIVRIDESVARESPATEADAETLVEQVERLLTASENGEDFQRRYFEALQRQPAVVLAHADVRRTLKARRE